MVGITHVVDSGIFIPITHAWRIYVMENSFALQLNAIYHNEVFSLRDSATLRVGGIDGLGLFTLSSA
jgi:hypothetical protein